MTEKAAALFRPPLILHSNGHTATFMMRDTALTVLVWLAWFGLLLLALGYFWIPPAWQWLFPGTYPEDRREVLRLARFCILLGVTVCALFALRMRIDRWRFSGRDRRRSLPMPDDDTLAADFGTTGMQMKQWMKARRLLIHHDEAGSPARVETSGGFLP